MGGFMTLQGIREFLGWCVVINYAVLMAWFVAFVLAGGWMRRLHGQWFAMSDECFNGIHYAGMAAYKVGILLFCLAPYVALHLCG
jgi:hypothetical protein